MASSPRIEAWILSQTSSAYDVRERPAAKRHASLRTDKIIWGRSASLCTCVSHNQFGAHVANICVWIRAQGRRSRRVPSKRNARRAILIQCECIGQQHLSSSANHNYYLSNRCAACVKYACMAHSVCNMTGKQQRPAVQPMRSCQHLSNLCIETVLYIIVRTWPANWNEVNQIELVAIHRVRIIRASTCIRNIQTMPTFNDRFACINKYIVNTIQTNCN